MLLTSILSLPPDLAAPRLLGAQILVDSTEGTTGGIIVEVEAYLPTDDPASHSYIGRTKRNQSMFMDAGTVYVYTLRHHTLANIVTEGIDTPGAILLRALEPNSGISVMQNRRGVDDVYKICRGPGNLAKALGITKEHDGHNILNTDSLIQLILSKRKVSAEHINLSPRVGITKNTSALLRFSLKDSKFVSR